MKERRLKLRAITGAMLVGYSGPGNRFATWLYSEARSFGGALAG